MNGELRLVRLLVVEATREAKRVKASVQRSLRSVTSDIPVHEFYELLVLQLHKRSSKTVPLTVRFL